MASPTSLQASAQELAKKIGESVQDASDESFLLFSQDIPSHSLGFVDGRAKHLEMQVAGRDITLRQSPGLLNSNREAGTTGAVLWKITPLIAEWLASMPQLLTSTGILHSDATVVELGCGITGLIGIILAPMVSSYLLTDQAYVLKVLRENTQANLPQIKPPNVRRKGQSARLQVPQLAKLKILPLDWETDSVYNLKTELGHSIDLVIVCDCVYNEYLIRPLLDTLVEVCQLSDKAAAVLIAQQLRSDSIFELFMEAMLTSFEVWRVLDEHLPTALKSGSGFVLHLAFLRLDDGR